MKEFKFLQRCIKKYNMHFIRLEIDRVKRGKAEIIEAIREKGIEVPDDVLIGDLPQYIRQIGKGAE